MKKTIWVNGDEFILVEAESLSADDKFMQYEPRTAYEGTVKTHISEAIQGKVKNFYCPKYAPSLTDDGKAICFVPDKKPALEHDYFRWYAWARRYCPERNSQLGTRLQYYAFLGVLMKKLVEEGKSVEWVWNAVCIDSKELGHYRNSENVKYDLVTGSNCICGLCDLAINRKFLAFEESSAVLMTIAGVSYDNDGSISVVKRRHIDANELFGGWIVLKKRKDIMWRLKMWWWELTYLKAY